MKIETPVNGYDIDVMVVGYPGRPSATAGLAGAPSCCCAATAGWR
jgi:hypothetical protein